MSITVTIGYNTMPQNDDTVINRRSMLQASAVGLATGAALTGAAVPAAGQENETEEESTNETTEEESTEEESTEEESTDEETEEETTPDCEGTPRMAIQDINTPSTRITQDDPAEMIASFRTDPSVPQECSVTVDLTFRMVEDGFQFSGGTDWDQNTASFVNTQFSVDPGEIRDLSALIHTQGAEEGDQLTVVASYELWYEGDRENSRQQEIRNTIQVEDPNPAPEGGEGSESGDDESEVSGSFDATPGLGIGSAIAGVGGAAYVLKSKLTGDSE